MGNCCELGNILEEEQWRVLFETNNFFIAPSIGPMEIEGYLMILSKKCHAGMGAIPESLHQELDEITAYTKIILKETYGQESQVFEHGPRVCGIRGGGCLDHAHLHVVPGVNLLEDLALDFMERLETTSQFYRIDRVEGFKRAMEIVQEKQTSYFMAEDPDGKRIIAEVNFHIPSQYMRKMIANQVGSAEWDWRLWPQYNVVKQTIETLQGKF